MDAVLNFIGLLGGIGALIIGIGSFSSKLWADWFMRKKTAEYDKQIEYYKNSLELERERFKALYDQVVYKNKAVFDVEFKIYQEITPKIIKCVDAFSDFINARLSDESFHEFTLKYADYNDALLKYASFIDEEMYKSMADFGAFIANAGMDIMLYNNDKYKNYIKDTEPDIEIFNELFDLKIIINTKMNDVINRTRKYIRDITVIK